MKTYIHVRFHQRVFAVQKRRFCVEPPPSVAVLKLPSLDDGGFMQK